MSGPKLIALLLFGVLSFLFGALFSIGLEGAFSAVVTGVVVAALTCVFIWFAKTVRHAFARGFLALGAVFIIVPIAALAGLGQHVAEGTVSSLQANGTLTEEETTALVVASLFASAGLVFGVIIGLILVLIGGLMHRAPKDGSTP